MPHSQQTKSTGTRTRIPFTRTHRHTHTHRHGRRVDHSSPNANRRRRLAKTSVTTITLASCLEVKDLLQRRHAAFSMHDSQIALGGETASAAVLPSALPLDIAALSGERVGEFRGAGITSTCCTALEAPHHELHHSSTGTDLKHLPSRTHIVHLRETRDH